MASQVYELRTDNAYVGLTFLDPGNFIFPIEARMKTLQRLGPDFAVIFDSRRVKPATVKVPDLVRLSPAFCCFGDAAWTLLKKELRLRGSSVRLVLNQTGRKLEFVLFEPSPPIDCFDFGRSKVEYFDALRRRVKWVDDVVLKNVTAVREDIFRVKHLLGQLFCTEKCVDFVKTHKLAGFDFRRVTIGD